MYLCIYSAPLWTHSLLPQNKTVQVLDDSAVLLYYTWGVMRFESGRALRIVDLYAEVLKRGVTDMKVLEAGE